MTDLSDELVIEDPDDPSGATVVFILAVNFVLGIMAVIAIAKWTGIIK